MNSFGTGKLPDGQMASIVRDHFPLAPRGIIQHLDLLKPVYRRTAAYGHFGREGFTWENTDIAKDLSSAAA